jgi:DNA-directed RNA polymerase beta' subunit
MIKKNLIKKENNLQIINKEIEIKESGADAIKYLLDKLDLNKEIKKNRLSLILGGFSNTLEDNDYKETREKLIKRIRLLENFISSRSKPTWMILEIIPVIPPGLRPMVQLDSGRFATSDLNELYRSVIIRNNRLQRLIKLMAPEIITYNEKRLFYGNLNFSNKITSEDFKQLLEIKEDNEFIDKLFNYLLKGEYIITLRNNIVYYRR